MFSGGARVGYHVIRPLYLGPYRYLNTTRLARCLATPPSANLWPRLLSWPQIVEETLPYRRPLRKSRKSIKRGHHEQSSYRTTHPDRRRGFWNWRGLYWRRSAGAGGGCRTRRQYLER